MYNIFLKLKHWHLFGIMFLLPIYVLRSCILSNSYLSQFLTSDSGDRSFVIPAFLIFVSILLYYFWILAIVKKAHQIVAPDLRPKLWTFNFFWGLRVLTYIGILFFVAFVLGDFSFDLDIPKEWNVTIVVLFFVGYIMSLFGSFYCISTAAKLIKKVEEDRPISFDHSFGLFMGFLFFPIGVWFIQPKVNRFLIPKKETIIEELV